MIVEIIEEKETEEQAANESVNLEGRRSCNLLDLGSKIVTVLRRGRQSIYDLLASNYPRWRFKDPRIYGAPP